MRVKICGITSPEDACVAAEAGADAIGLNLISGPRRVEYAQAERVLCALPPLVMPVALVRLQGDALAIETKDWLQSARISHLQLYGEVTAEAVARLCGAGFSPIPVMRIGARDFLQSRPLWLEGDVRARAVVLDTYEAGREGGTGQSFPWHWVAHAKQAGWLADWPPIILAGGLRPDNVAEAVGVVRPYGVDVSSGVEVEGRPGLKDFEKVRDFITAARAAAE